jgi:hypothetical protein
LIKATFVPTTGPLNYSYVVKSGRRASVVARKGRTWTTIITKTNLSPADASVHLKSLSIIGALVKMVMLWALSSHFNETEKIIITDATIF